MIELKPGKDGYPTNGLRDDGRQWLIYGEEQQGALLRGLEAMCMSMAGQSLVRLGYKTRIQAIRTLGFVAINQAGGRIAAAQEAGGYRAVVMDYLVKVMAFLSGATDEIPDPQVFDELQATAWQLDHRSRSAGYRGDGTLREMIRGDI